VNTKPSDVFLWGGTEATSSLGVQFPILWPGLTMSKSILAPQPTPLELLEYVTRHKATVIGNGPSGYHEMIQHYLRANETSPFDLSSIRIPICGGEALSKTLYEAWHKVTNHKSTLINVIGTTEINALNIASSSSDPPGTLGRAITGWEARIVNEEFQEVERGTSGFLITRGPSSCIYFNEHDNDDEKQRKSVKNGWNFLRDVAYQDEDGLFWHCSRVDDVIIIDRKNVYPIEVESVLRQLDIIDDVAIVGVDNAIKGTKGLKAVVVLSEMEGKKEEVEVREKIERFAEDKLQKYKRPIAIDFAESLPRSVRGKVSTKR